MITGPDLDRLARDIEERARAALRAAGEAIAADARSRIGQERAEWPPLAQGTVEAKERAGHTGRVSATDPLLASGAMRASIEVEVSDPDAIIVGSRSPLAPVHELGTSEVPPRPFLLPAAIEGAQGAADAVRDAVRAALDEAFGRR